MWKVSSAKLRPSPITFEFKCALNSLFRTLEDTLLPVRRLGTIVTVTQNLAEHQLLHKVSYLTSVTQSIAIKVSNSQRIEGNHYATSVFENKFKKSLFVSVNLGG